MNDTARAVPEGMAGDIATALGKASPPLAVTGATVAGMPLESWVVILTVVYLALQIAYLVYKFARDLRRDRGDDEQA